LSGIQALHIPAEPMHICQGCLWHSVLAGRLAFSAKALSMNLTKDRAAAGAFFIND
jgi:hypothetical protein